MSPMKEILPMCYQNGSMKRVFLHHTNDPTIVPSDLNTSEEDIKVILIAHLSSEYHHQEEMYMPWDARAPMFAHSINDQC